jgi:hypothetical protein
MKQAGFFDVEERLALLNDYALAFNLSRKRKRRML